jgi:hypothetical protein
LEKEGKQGGFGQKTIFFLLSRYRTERGGIGRRPTWREGAPAALATAAAGEWGNTERGTRGSHPRAHLGLGRAVEVALRGGSGAAAVLGGGGAVELGERGGGCCEAGSGEVRRPGE